MPGQPFPKQPQGGTNKPLTHIGLPRLNFSILSDFILSLVRFVQSSIYSTYINMRYCKHTQWLGLAVNDGDVVLQNTDRLETLLEDLPDPDEQSPSLFVFIGNRSKAMAIKELAKTFSPPPDYGHDSSRQSQHDDELNRRGRSKLNGRRTHGEIHLHIHPPSTFSSKPVLLAEGDLPSLHRSRLLAIEKCHETANRLMDAGALITPTLSECADRIYFKLLSPFADVFCFFADDVGGLRPIVQRLAIWLDLGQPSTLPESTRPKILIVTERERDMTIIVTNRLRALSNRC